MLKEKHTQSIPDQKMYVLENPVQLEADTESKKTDRLDIDSRMINLIVEVCRIDAEEAGEAEFLLKVRAIITFVLATPGQTAELFIKMLTNMRDANKSYDLEQFSPVDLFLLERNRNVFDDLVNEIKFSLYKRELNGAEAEKRVRLYALDIFLTLQDSVLVQKAMNVLTENFYRKKHTFDTLPTVSYLVDAVKSEKK